MERFASDVLSDSHVDTFCEEKMNVYFCDSRNIANILTITQNYYLLKMYKDSYFAWLHCEWKYKSVDEMTTDL